MLMRTNCLERPVAVKGSSSCVRFWPTDSELVLDGEVEVLMVVAGIWMRQLYASKNDNRLEGRGKERKPGLCKQL